MNDAAPQHHNMPCTHAAAVLSDWEWLRSLWDSQLVLTDPEQNQKSSVTPWHHQEKLQIVIHYYQDTPAAFFHCSPSLGTALSFDYFVSTVLFRQYEHSVTKANVHAFLCELEFFFPFAVCFGNRKHGHHWVHIRLAQFSSTRRGDWARCCHRGFTQRWLSKCC